MIRRVVFVDGYNLILRSPALRPGPDRTMAQAREKLLSLLGWAVGARDVEFVVVFDGAEGVAATPPAARIRVIYSKPPEKADHVIRRLVEERAGRGTAVTVVTADAEVARHARAMGADLVLSDLFLASVLPPGGAEVGEAAEKPTHLSKQELEEWAELFRRGKPEPD
jgi:predicted RNA-binding protein with PIN domain